jgi:hypothetical protein
VSVTYTAVLDVSEDSVTFVSGLLDLDLSRVWQGWPPVDGAKILIMGSVR